MRTEVYPCTIIKDRYEGTYSRGAWTAWNEYERDIPTDASSSDNICADFWYDNKEKPIGRGETPEGALRDLIKRLDLNGS